MPEKGHTGETLVEARSDAHGQLVRLYLEKGAKD